MAQRSIASQSVSASPGASPASRLFYTRPVLFLIFAF
jgi:hypothetical protein